MSTISCFAPIADKDARVLILGSMPGVASLNQQQYYAHTRNSFWYIMADFFSIKPDASYKDKISILKSKKIAVWDVLKNCVRPGSLDTDINSESIVANDFLVFFRQHQKIKHVFFNGQKAEKEFNKHVIPILTDQFGDIQYHLLPSTSPAMAGLNKDQKLAIWHQIKGKLLEDIK